MKNQYPDAKAGEARYVEYDDKFEMWGIFGEDSGHCSGQFASEEQAQSRLDDNR